MPGISPARSSAGTRSEPPKAGSLSSQPAPAFGELSSEERSVLLRVVDILRDIDFGTVLLVVQDGKVVQIEMAEKFRLR